MQRTQLALSLTTWRQTHPSCRDAATLQTGCSTRATVHDFSNSSLNTKCANSVWYRCTYILQFVQGFDSQKTWVGGACLASFVLCSALQGGTICRNFLAIYMNLVLWTSNSGLLHQIPAEICARLVLKAKIVATRMWHPDNNILRHLW